MSYTLHFIRIWRDTQKSIGYLDTRYRFTVFTGFLMLWRSGNPLMMYWNNCLPSMGTWGGLEILLPLQPPTLTSPLVKAGHVPLAGITEGTTLPTKNIQVQAQVSSQSLNLILSTNECRWCLRSVLLGLYTLYPWTGVVQGQFQLRSQDPGLPSEGWTLNFGDEPEVGKPFSLCYLELSLCNSIASKSE